MNKKPKEFSKKFKDFVNSSIKEILYNADLPDYTFNITFINEHVTDHKEGHSHSLQTQAEINVLPEYQSFSMAIFKSL